MPICRLLNLCYTRLIYANFANTLNQSLSSCLVGRVVWIHWVQPYIFLDERPAKRENWTLIGCERSLQFHRHYYGDEPPRVEMCPRQLVKNDGTLTILECCLLEYDIEQQGALTVVPWGADLKMIEKALRQLAGVGNV